MQEKLMMIQDVSSTIVKDKKKSMECEDEFCVNSHIVVDIVISENILF